MHTVLVNIMDHIRLDKYYLALKMCDLWKSLNTFRPRLESTIINLAMPAPQMVDDYGMKCPRKVILRINRIACKKNEIAYTFICCKNVKSNSGERNSQWTFFVLYYVSHKSRNWTNRFYFDTHTLDQWVRAHATSHCICWIWKKTTIIA